MVRGESVVALVVVMIVMIGRCIVGSIDIVLAVRVIPRCLIVRGGRRRRGMVATVAY